MQQNYELQFKLLQHTTHTYASDSGLLTKHSKNFLGITVSPLQYLLSQSFMVVMKHK